MKAEYWTTTNKSTGEKGCAARTNDGLVRIYEGRPDGSDDKTVTEAEFQEGWVAEPEAPEAE